MEAVGTGNMVAVGPPLPLANQGDSIQSSGVTVGQEWVRNRKLVAVAGRR